MMHGNKPVSIIGGGIRVNGVAPAIVETPHRADREYERCGVRDRLSSLGRSQLGDGCDLERRRRSDGRPQRIGGRPIDSTRNERRKTFQLEPRKFAESLKGENHD